MKVSYFFHSIFAKYFFLIFFAAWAANASAYYKINYESADFTWQSEEYRLDNDDYAYGGDFFFYETINFDIELIIPEFEFPDIEPVLYTFDDVVVGINTSNFFASPVVTNSRFELELTPQDVLNPLWSLTFDLVDNRNPANNPISSGTYLASGSLEWNADGSGTGGGWADFVYHLDNWVYKRHDVEWVLDSEVHFVTETNRLTIEKVSVSEPLSPALLLLGLVGIFATRKMKTLTDK